MSQDPSPPTHPGEGSLRPQSLTELFLVFTGLALRGFGGVLPWAQRVLVEERRWLSREQFIETLAFGQLLPGPNVCNVAIMVGDRWFGWRGAAVALAGMLAAPMLLVLTAAVLFGQVADDPLVRRVVTGMGAVAGGMILATAFKLVLAWRAHWAWLLWGALAFVGVAWLHLSVRMVLAVLVPAALLIAWRVLPGSRAGDGADR